VGQKLVVLNCGLSSTEDTTFKAVTSLLPGDVQTLLKAQGRLLIVAESADSIAPPEKAK
jgi:hypothetical protein